jgi:lysozyme family protein
MKYTFIAILLAGFFSFLSISVNAESCATILSVNSSVQQLQPATDFTCTVEVDQPHAGSSFIACGVSFDGKYPENFCPSDSQFQGWQGNRGIFGCNIEQSAFSVPHSTAELVAFDFQTGCGLPTAKRLAVLFPSPTPTSVVPSTSAPVTIIPTFEKRSEAQNAPVLNTKSGIAQGVVPNPPSTPFPSIPIGELFNTKDLSSLADLKGIAESCLENKDVYEQASATTGVPWQVLAGIHSREGNCGKNKSLISGRTIGQNEPDLLGNCAASATGLGKPFPIAGGCAFKTLLDTAIYSGNHLKGKIGIIPTTIPQLTLALTRYNGGGNANCGKTPYSSCPKLYPGEDDTYVMNKFDDRHNRMFIVYCADYTMCQPPKVDTRPGTLTISSIMSSL